MTSSHGAGNEDRAAAVRARAEQAAGSLRVDRALMQVLEELQTNPDLALATVSSKGKNLKKRSLSNRALKKAVNFARELIRERGGEGATGIPGVEAAEENSERRRSMSKLPPTLLKALTNQELGIYKSEGHLTACQSCGRKMYHNMSGSDEDLCWVEVGREGGPTTRVYLCAPCLGKIRAEQASTE